jgi:hypothetical protein
MKEGNFFLEKHLFFFQISVDAGWSNVKGVNQLEKFLLLEIFIVIDFARPLLVESRIEESCCHSPT